MTIDTAVKLVTTHNQTEVTVTLYSDIPSSRKTGEVLSSVHIEAVTPIDDEDDEHYPLYCQGCQHRTTTSFSLTIGETKTLANGILGTVGGTK